MKQVLIQKGIAKVIDVPSPKIGKGEVLVAVQASTISIGTEVAEIKNSGDSLYSKALKQPEKVLQTINHTYEFGFKNTYDLIKNKEREFTPTGYSCSGIVVDVSPEIKDICIGQRVACCGSKYAFHAEFIRVPRNLCVPFSKDINFNFASTVSLGAIALQGIRRAQPSLGELFVVIGLGFLGQLTVQLLKANGCRVIAIDKDISRVNKAIEMGINYASQDENDLLIKSKEISSNIGADAVIITASSLSDSIVSQAFKLCRKKGRVVLVGDVGLNLKRDDFYKNEIDFLISCSYGPGRYDSEYEEKGVDYPIGYVRWTENRNMDAYLSLIKEKKVNLSPLFQKTYSIDKAKEAYESINNKVSPILVILNYQKYDPEEKVLSQKVNLEIIRRKKQGLINIGVIGAGAFAKSIHLPNIKSLKDKFELIAIANNSGVSSINVGKQFNAKYISTNYEDLINDPEIESILISTRHNLHAELVLKSIKKGKNVFVEKPLALNKKELIKLKEYYLTDSSKPILFTGYNRRFSSHIKHIKKYIENNNLPFILNYRVNAGFIKNDNWIQKNNEGGGRNIGEACHFYDLFCFLADSEIYKITANAINFDNLENFDSENTPLPNENFIATLKFKNQCICNLIYTSMGNKKVEKEYMELFIGQNIFILQDFKKLEFIGNNSKIYKINKKDKGLKTELIEFYNSVQNSKNIIPINDQFRVSEISFEVEDLIKKNR